MPSQNSSKKAMIIKLLQNCQCTEQYNNFGQHMTTAAIVMKITHRNDNYSLRFDIHTSGAKIGQGYQTLINQACRQFSTSVILTTSNKSSLFY